MGNIEVCFSPELIHLYDLKGKIVIVVDILRASSTMVTGLAHGLKCIAPVENIEETVNFAKKGYLVAGERNGKKVEGFDLGNSPFEFMEAGKKEASVVMTTTNGTKALKNSLSAEKVIVGSFLNINSVSEYLIEEGLDVVIFCAGWKGRFNLEDTLFSGALIREIQKVERKNLNCDAAIAALSLYEKHENDISEIISKAAHVNRLGGLEAKKDVEFCMTFNLFKNIPYYSRQHLTNI